MTDLLLDPWAEAVDEFPLLAQIRAVDFNGALTWAY